jgi:hypothetical protein
VRTVTPTLAAAIATPERVLGVALKMDWDFDGYNGDGTIDDLGSALNRVTVSQTLTTQVPSAAQPIVGAAAAQLTADLEQGHFFGASRVPRVRAVTTSTAATGTGVVSVARPTARAGDTVLVWIASPASPQYTIRGNGNNAVWYDLTFRADSNADSSRLVTAHMLVRHIPADAAGFAAEPTTYTFRISDRRSFSAIAVVIEGGVIPGIHKFSSKGSDTGALGTTYTQLDGVPVTTTIDSCLLLGFFAGWAGPGGGVTWTPVGAETELADTCSTNGVENATISAMQLTGVATGAVTMSATISTPTEPGVVTTIALAPMSDGDDTKNAAWTFSELNPVTPYAGKQRDNRPVQLALSVATDAGIETVPLFTGRSIGIDVSSRSRRATLTALDNRELMRTSAVNNTSLPTVIAESPETAFGETLPYYPGLDATWIVSYCFAWCRLSSVPKILNAEGPIAGDGFFASPNVRPATMIHVPFHGSLTPFIGFMSYGYRQTASGQRLRPTFERGPYVSSTSPADVGGKIDAKWVCNLPSTPWTSAGQSAGRIEYAARLSVAGAGTMTVGVAARDTPTLRYAYLNIDATRTLTLLLGMNGGFTRTVTGPVLPNDQAWHNVGVHWDATTGSATFRVDSTNTVVGFATFTGTAPADVSVNAFATLTDGAQIAELQVAGSYPVSPGTHDNDIVVVTDPFIWENFTPTAFIDKSENVMDGTVAVDTGSDLWTLVSQLAEAEFAAVYFDADGFPHYRTRYSDVTDVGITSVRTLTSLNALKDVDYESGIDQLTNQVQANYTPITVVLDGVAWKPTQAQRVPANSSVTIIVTMPGVQLPTATSSVNLGNANTAPDGSGTDVLAGYSMSTQFSGVQLTITLQNTNTFDIYMVDPTGQTTTFVRTSWMTSGTTFYGTTWRDDESIRRHGEQPLTNGLQPSRWRQRQDASDNIAIILLSDLAEPRPVLTNVRIVGDPRLQLGDVVTLVDPDGLNLNDSYRLVGISPEYGPTNGFTQSLVARSTGCGVAIWDTTYWDDCTVWGA